jgi:hypothetical protein
MKNAFLAILFLSTVTLCAVVLGLRTRIVNQAHLIVQTQARVTELEQQLAAKSEAVEKAQVTERKAEVLQDVLTSTSSDAKEKTKQVEQLQQALATVKTNEPGNLLGSMFKDPKMKEMISAQQKLYIGPMIDKSYSALFQQLGLSPDQTTTLKDLLEKKMLAGANAGMSMLSGDMDAEKRSEMMKQIKTETDGVDAQIKQFLGEDNYQAFQSYEKTVPDRMVANQFKDQLSNTANALSPAQDAQLIQAFADTRSSFPWTIDFANKKNAPDDLAGLLTEDNLAKYEQEKTQYDQQVLTRAQQFLSPDQVTALTQFSDTQRKMQMVGMKFAAKMFAPKGQ